MSKQVTQKNGSKESLTKWPETRRWPPSHRPTCGYTKLIWWQSIKKTFCFPFEIIIIFLDYQTQIFKPFEMTAGLKVSWTLVRECARTLWMGAPFWGKGEPVPKGGNKERQLSPDRERDKTWYVVRWEDGKKMRKTTPSRLQDASMHRVSWCAQLEDKSECIGDVSNCVLTVFIVSGK